MKKRGLRTMLAIAVITVMMFAMGVVAMAAEQEVDMSIKQQENDFYGTSYDEKGDNVSIKWNYLLGSDEHIHVEYSTDGKNWKFYGNTRDSEEDIDGLAPGSTYYVRLCVYSEYYCDKDDKNVTEAYKGIKSKAVKVRTACEAVNSKSLQWTASTATTITLKWSAVSGAEEYRVYVYNNGYIQVASTKKTQVTIKGLKASSDNSYYVAPVCTGAGGYKMVGKKTSDVYASTLPAKVTGLKVANAWTSLGDCQFAWNNDSVADGYQVVVARADGKKTYHKADVPNILKGETFDDDVTFSKFKFYGLTRTRVRAYVEIGGKKVYGPWSNYLCYGKSSKVTVKRISKGKQIKVSWKKVTGASHCYIYVSTSKNSGYKKVAAVSSKKTSYIIKKYKGKSLRKNKKYYVRVRYVYKSGKTTYTSTQKITKKI